MKKSKPAVVKEQTMLKGPKADAMEKITKQLQDGEVLHDLSVNNEATLEAFNEKHKIWSEYTVQLLLNLFTDSSISDEFNYAPHYVMMDRDWNIGQIHKYHLENQLKPELSALRSIIKRLEIIDVKTASSPSASVSVSKSVFIVHGSDLDLKNTVARFIEKLDLSAIVLHEQANKGQTIIEKIERHSDVGFAVILLTPDDVGGKNLEELQPRARQNVILELGYFMGKLERKRVCALYREGVEIPSDFDGVLYVPFDDKGAWQLSLVKEIRVAGMDVDLNKAIE